MAEPAPAHQSLVKLVKLFPGLPALVLSDVFGAVLPAFDHPVLIAADVTLISRPDRGDDDVDDGEAQAHAYSSDQAVAYCDGAGRPLWAAV